MKKTRLDIRPFLKDPRQLSSEIQRKLVNNVGQLPTTNILPSIENKLQIAPIDSRGRQALEILKLVFTNLRP